MVAHNIADASFLLTVMVRRRTFFQKYSSIVSRSRNVNASIVSFRDVIERGANRRIRGGAMSRGGRFDRVWSFMWDGESAVKSDFPVLVGLGRLQDPAHVGPASWNRTWSPQ